MAEPRGPATKIPYPCSVCSEQTGLQGRRKEIVISTPTSGSRRWWALFLLCAAQFVVIMDTSIIGVALPQMQSDLGFSPENLS